ncbi:hypothetical protein HanIR_Chr03g0118691 [Helianthus annuus]|nr:hypothetical protein HanIR_Chr03g0118691 [Helianthus annuus]
MISTLDQTSHESSQKDHVGITGTPHHEALLSFESMLKSPSPGAMSLSAPQPSSAIPTTIIPLFEIIDIQTQNSLSHQHITKSITQQMTVSEPIQSANPQTVEEDTPHEFYKTLGGISSGATTTTGEPIGFLLDNGYITKTPLKATTVEATTVTSVPVGSPQNQEKGAFVYDHMETSLVIKTNTTTSGRNSNDPIKLGDELRYKDLTDRMSSVENSVGEMKDMMKHMLENSKCKPSTQQITQEIWNYVQPILAAQRELAELNHNKHIELNRIMVEARYKDTQADIRGIKESLLKLTGSSPTPVFEKDDEDDAKKGEKDIMRKSEPDPKVKPKSKVQQNLRSAKQTSAKTSETSDVGKKKGIDETLNIQTDEKILEKQKKQDTEESRRRKNMRRR